MLTIHKASAGSGKTFTLAREYIKLILGLKNNETGEYLLRRGDNDGFRSVLAITFTNKATEEMKNRIIKELALLSDTRSESAHREELMKILHCGAGDLAEASGRALRNMLFNYNGFHVSTIDAFSSSYSKLLPTKPTSTATIISNSTIIMWWPAPWRRCMRNSTTNTPTAT